jgi:hypothetical protein
MAEAGLGESLLRWLEGSTPALALRQSIWLYPGVEIIHITGFALLFGAAFLYDLRLLGISRQMPVSTATRHLSRWALYSLIAVVPSGFLLFMVDATSMAMNHSFQLKMLFFALAGINAAVFHHFTARGSAEWDVGVMPPLRARLTAIASILLWLSVISTGRLIAYV